MIAIKNLLVRTAAIGAIGVTAMTGFMAPASASQAPAAHMVSAAPAVTGPNTNIKAGPLRWAPAKLTAPPVKAGSSCTAKNFSFTITNKTAAAHKILVKTGTSPKQLLGTIKAHTKAAICGSGPKGSKAKFFIKGSTSVLVVTLS